MLTETTAELAAALTLAAARRVCEADVFMRGGQYKGWLPTLFVGQLLQVGCGSGVVRTAHPTAQQRIPQAGTPQNLGAPCGHWHQRQRCYWPLKL